MKKILSTEVSVVPYLTCAKLIDLPILKDNQECSNCHKKAEHEVITIGKRKWHRKCFQCSLCEVLIEESEYMIIDEKPVHVDCFFWIKGPFCSACSQPLKK